MKFNKEKCKVLLLERDKAPGRAGDMQLENSLTGKNLEFPHGHQVDHEPPKCLCSKEG